MAEKPLNIDHTRDNQYFPVEQNGHLLCSCGRPLEKLEDGIYQCSYGYPTFRLDAGDIRIDKYGNMLFKRKGHGTKED